MVRVLGIVGGIAVGWYAEEVGIDIVYWGLALAFVLTITNLVIALVEFKRDPHGVLAEVLLTSNQNEWPRTFQEYRDARIRGWPFLQIIWRYNRVCFFLNAATIGVTAAVTYLIMSLLR